MAYDSPIVKIYGKISNYELECVDGVIQETDREIRPSNQRGELIAFVYAMDTMIKFMQLDSNKNIDDSFPRFELNIITDSKYCLGVVTSWMHKWIKNNTLETKKNIDLVKILHQQYQTITSNGKIVVNYTPASHDVKKIPTDKYGLMCYYGNEVADSLAHEYIKLQDTKPQFALA